MAEIKANTTKADTHQLQQTKNTITQNKLECGPMPNVIVALRNIGGALCSMLQSLADTHYLTPVQYRCQDEIPVEV